MAEDWKNREEGVGWTAEGYSCKLNEKQYFLIKNVFKTEGDNQPTHVLYAVEKIGAAWPTKTGSGLSIKNEKDGSRHIAFKNKYKEQGSTAPDINIYRSEDTGAEGQVLRGVEGKNGEELAIPPKEGFEEVPIAELEEKIEEEYEQYP